MSLDVYLTVDNPVKKQGSGIFVREDGQVKEISRAEWDEKFPGREPFVAKTEDSNRVFSANITHNLGEMADKANLYLTLWRPEELGYTRAGELIANLQAGLEELVIAPSYFKQFNPENGWGTYEGLVEFVKEYLAACKEYPQAKVNVWR